MKRRFVRPLALALIAAALFVLNRRYGWSQLLFGEQGVARLRALASRSGTLAVLAYLGLTSAGCVLLALPGVTFAVVGALLFGPFWGALWCLVAATLGAVLAFLAGRYFLRDSVLAMVEKSPPLKRLLFDEAGRSALYLLMITRLLPIFPYNLQNFAYGATGVGLLPYAVYTFLFMIPGVALFTFGTAGAVFPERRALNLTLTALTAVLLAAAGRSAYRRWRRERENA